MPRHPMPFNADSSESRPSSLKSSPSKRERVRKFLRRVSSIGQRNSKRERKTSQSIVVAEAQAPGSVRDASSHEQHHVIDLTIEPIPIKALRRDSISSSTGGVLGPKAVGGLAAAAIDDASSFRSSAPSESSASDSQSDNDKQVLESQPAVTPHVEPEQPAASTSASAEIVLEIPPVDETPAEGGEVDPANIPLPADDEEDFNPVSSEVLESLPEDRETSIVVEAQAPIASNDADIAPQEASVPSVDAEPKDPFDDAYAADTESVSTASPELAPIVVLDFVETMELNEPGDAPAPIEAAVEPEPQHEVSESSERAFEPPSVAEANIAETIEAFVSPAPELAENTAAPAKQSTEAATSEVPASEPQPAEVEATTEAPSAPASDIPYVVIVPPSPISVSEPSVPATESTPSISKDTSPSSPSISSISPTLTPEPARASLVPFVSWIVSSFSTFKAFLPARRTALRWRTPVCYGVAVMCYSLTWYLSRRPPVNVELNRFNMY